MISRRGALSVLGSASLLAALQPRGAAATTQPPAPRPMAGDLDLSTFDIVDSHMHPVRRMLISQSYAGQMAEFGALGAPKGDYPNRDAIVARAQEGGRELVMNAPRRTGYINYIARAYGVPATIEGFDSVTKQHIGSDQDFVRYISAIFAREKIATVVLQAAEPAPSPPATLIPADRYVWTTVASELTRIGWAKERGLTTLADVRAAIDKTMESAVERGCRGFKSMAAYYRPLAVSKRTASEAEAAMKRVLAATPTSTGVQNQPIYADAATNAALTTYEDFLFRHVFAKAGALERPVIIHSAVALHPSLRVDFNDPRSEGLGEPA